jgi:hypothetical protein
VRIGDAWWIRDGTTYTRVASAEMAATIETDVARSGPAQNAASTAASDPPIEADRS